jgi:hypothetical protein
MEHFVRERKVRNAFFINAWIEILMVTPGKSPISKSIMLPFGKVEAKSHMSNLRGMYPLRSNPMMNIKNACNAIEPKAVKVILLHPKTEVTQEKPKDFMVAIVE